MSYDLLVWEGRPPVSDAEAAEVSARWMDVAEQIAESGETPVPSDRIRAYVVALLGKWPDIDADDAEESPWAVTFDVVSPGRR